MSLLDALGMSETGEKIEFEPPRHKGSFHRSADLED